MTDDLGHRRKTRNSDSLPKQIDDGCGFKIELEILADIRCLTSLKALELCGNNFESLPKSIKQLTNLRSLLLNDCNMLQSLTELPSELQYLEAVDCEQLQSLPDASQFAELGTLTREVHRFMKLNLLFTNCLKLNEKALSSVFAESLLLIIQPMSTIQEYEGQFEIRMCYLVSEIPDWFSYRCSESIVNIQLPPHNVCNRKFFGFALCVVIELKEYSHGSSMVNYKWHSENNQGLRNGRCRDHLTIIANRAHKDRVFIDSDHILLGYLDLSGVELLRDDYKTCSVEFWPSILSQHNCKVKYCGVHPIYAEHILNQLHNFGPTHQDFGETSGTGSGEPDDHGEVIEPTAKRICTESNRSCSWLTLKL
ncbi:hypothetical protein EZV62_018897 [Acer yangbiense]|uniref:C-JID domain-containing protein n=1 Tax=Acer yangbiense TaxID=1000413 RepID=A0A5C7H9Q0_9ROSI|nr:hypothetical protein EZV62_018897 [Acer yangbiense]